MEKNLLALIEDDPIQRRILTTMLNEHFTVQSYSSYQEAKGALRNPTLIPSLILCDITLPDGNGLDLRQEMLAEDRLVTCPFVFLSSRHDEKTKHNAAQLGIDDFLDKPVQKEALLTALERTLKRSAHLKQIMHKRLNDELTEPLQPTLPKSIGPYRIYLAHQGLVSGGGDFAFHLSAANQDYIILGDVMGHGAPAKFFLHAYAGYLYGLIQSFRHYDLAPGAAHLLDILNNMLTADEFLKRWLLTCSILCIGDDGAMTYASAGHPQAWKKSVQGATAVTGQGPMPGLIEHLMYQEKQIDLAEGESLFLATDGAELEGINLDRLHQQFQDGRIEQLIASWDAHDDATLVMLERVATLPVRSSSYRQ